MVQCACAVPEQVKRGEDKIDFFSCQIWLPCIPARVELSGGFAGGRWETRYFSVVGKREGKRIMCNVHILFDTPTICHHWFAYIYLLSPSFPSFLLPPAVPPSSPPLFVLSSFIPEFFDLVVWGHEHECLIEPEYVHQGVMDEGGEEKGVYISQPGSSVTKIRREKVGWRGKV